MFFLFRFRRSIFTADTDIGARRGDWAKKPFKKLTLDALGENAGGHLHPLMKVRTAFRELLLGMGFEEMPTDRWVESSFWNFDALFQPQQHPARDAHDTFFLDGMRVCLLADS